MRGAAWSLILVAGCASARTPGELDAAVDGEPADAAEVDGAVDAAETDAAMIDAAVIDAAVIDGAVIDAAMIDARPIDAMIDATPIDAPCTPTWQPLLVNGGFDGATPTPWTQTSTIIGAPSSPAAHSAPNIARFGANNNANDVLVQTVAIPAGATGLRLRGYECHVTEDVVSNADTFKVTVETPAGVVLETLRDITNSDVAPICAWLPFTWTAATAHPGQTVVLRLQGRTNLAFLTRFSVDTLTLEALSCP